MNRYFIPYNLRFFCLAPKKNNRHRLTEQIMPSKCNHGDCTTGPSYGLLGTKKAEYCIKHAKQGMVNVRDKRCAYENVGLGF